MCDLVSPKGWGGRQPGVLPLPTTVVQRRRFQKATLALSVGIPRHIPSSHADPSLQPVDLFKLIIILLALKFPIVSNYSLMTSPIIKSLHVSRTHFISIPKSVVCLVIFHNSSYTIRCDADF